jgi:ribokinase
VRLAVVGHVEWVEFVRVDRIPQRGEIVQAQETWQEAAGGGADAAVQMAKLAGAATLFTAFGDDVLGRCAAEELRDRGVRVEAAWRSEPQRRAVCFLDGGGERTITLLGAKLVPCRADRLPWGELAQTDGVYFTGGDVEALRAARSACVLVASARELPTLRDAGVEVDVLIASRADAGERYADGELDLRPRYVVRTEGERGGIVEPGGRFAGASPPGPVVDTYGAGDAFAAGLTYALADRQPMDAALAFAARCGAAVLTARGPYDGQLTL